MQGFKLTISTNCVNFCSLQEMPRILWKQKKYKEMKKQFETTSLELHSGVQKTLEDTTRKTGPTTNMGPPTGGVGPLADGPLSPMPSIFQKLLSIDLQIASWPSNEVGLIQRPRFILEGHISKGRPPPGNPNSFRENSHSSHLRSRDQAIQSHKPQFFLLVLVLERLANQL